MNQVPAHRTRRRQAQQLNAVIDRALVDWSPEQRQKVLQLKRTRTIRQLAQRIHNRATLLAKRQRRDTNRIRQARDALILSLYASMAPKAWAVAWCDGSSMKLDSRRCAGIGGIVMDRDRVIVASISEAIGEKSAFAAELAALASVVRTAVDHGLQRLRVYTDNYGLAQLWREHRDDERLADIRQLGRELERFSLKAIPRRYNQPANALARQAARSGYAANGIRAVLFDFGGVLAEEGFRNGLAALAVEQGLDGSNMTEAGMQAVYDSGFVLGKGTVAHFWALLRQRTGLVGTDDDLTRRILDGFIVRPWMIELVQQLHDRGYITGILSDQTDWLDTLDKRDCFYRVFDKTYISFYLGKGKRDSSLFADVAADLGLPASAILFIDDDAGNVSRAREAGLQALQFVDRQRFMDELEQTLSGNSKID
jgi:FMN phosphatase YigB (HAD superfamily)/ribonuclease HI